MNMSNVLIYKVVTYNKKCKILKSSIIYKSASISYSLIY